MKINELSKFALTIFLLPWIPAYILYKHSLGDLAEKIIVGFMFIALLCFISKEFAKWLKETLTKIGHFLGKYIAIVILAICYVFVVVPTGFLMKLAKRDRLSLKKPNTNTYWKNYENNNSDYEYQF